MRSPKSLPPFSYNPPILLLLLGLIAVGGLVWLAVRRYNAQQECLDSGGWINEYNCNEHGCNWSCVRN